MAPIRSQKAHNLVEQDDRILLAIKAIENGNCVSIRAAAEAFAVPRSTLQDRMKGHESRVVHRHHRHKFSELEKNRWKNGYLQWTLEGLPLLYICYVSRYGQFTTPRP